MAVTRLLPPRPITARPLATGPTDWGYSQVGEDFNPEVGFLARSNYKRGELFLMRRIRPKDLWGLLEVRPHVSYNGYWDFDGFQQTGFTHLDVHWEFRNGYEFHSGVNFTREGVKKTHSISSTGSPFNPALTITPNRNWFFIRTEAAPLSFAVTTKIGGRFGGDRVSIAPTVRYRIGEVIQL